MGFTLIGAGLAFLANPNFNIIDILPDFIGLFLVCLGLIKLSHINADLNGAKNLFIALAGVGILKFFALGMLTAKDPTWYLLLSFSFGVIECIFFLYAANSLFSGIEWLGVKYNSEYVLSTYNSLGVVDTDKRRGSVRKIRKDVITRVKNTAITFYFVRTACATLPEFTQILKENLYIDYYQLYRPALYIIGALITIVCGIIFLIRLCSFITGIYRDKPFCECLKNAHDKFESDNVNFRTSRRMRFAMIAYSIAILATLRLGEDGLSLIPTAIPALFLIISSLLMFRDDKRSLVALIPSLALIILSIINYSAMSAYYTGTTKFEDIFHFEKYMHRFSPISNLNLLEYILLIASFVSVSVVLFKLMRRHSEWDRVYTGMSETAVNTVRKENREYLEKLIKLQCVVLGIPLFLNTIGVKLAIAVGFSGSDFAVVAYQIYIAVTFVLTLIGFVISRRMTEFAKTEIYNVEYSWSIYESAND